MVENQRRFDGTRQFEIVIDNPSYPDPFAAGTIRQTLPSMRVTDPDLVAPYVGRRRWCRSSGRSSRNLLVTATYDYLREYHRLRTRNLNAPFDATASSRARRAAETPVERVRPAGPVDAATSSTSSRRATKPAQRCASAPRQRFSIFNVSVNYRTSTSTRRRAGRPRHAADRHPTTCGPTGAAAPQPTHTSAPASTRSLPLGIFVSGEMDYHSGRLLHDHDRPRRQSRLATSPIVPRAACPTASAVRAI